MDSTSSSSAAATTTAIFSPSCFIHVSFFTFTCCYSKISCPNRHLGSTLPTSLVLLRLHRHRRTLPSNLLILLPLPLRDSSSTLPSSSSFSIRASPSFFIEAVFLRLLICFVLRPVFAAFIPPALRLLLLLLLLRGCLPGATACPRSHRDFFQKIQLRRSFMGVRPLAAPECASLQLAHL